MHAHTHGDPAGADNDAIALAVEVFAMLADATRVRIILALGDGELAVGELAETVGKAQAAVSQHLAKLRMARMVATRHDGNRVYYRLADEHAKSLVDNALQQAEHAVDARPSHHEATR
ncbi:metalloregulator ArsR/SmtB family transcription factor [Actinotalea sp. M2MS4P-6]|uniref:ArsR/SmtB family transcription factor n=1 Tax=Actinotalea sp. M2MS4P-6 TaxID=2983762 RepID=UPI0021E40062|nr:metalloregulator ArsR/SmtB family transcription factor [Actinotalea sp. M2MS4P-6]MCV2393837.1 metalloregulator ArsR/SmtB family transcription factor [Actinotalea sp. M2MS4P-6]